MAIGKPVGKTAAGTGKAAPGTGSGGVAGKKPGAAKGATGISLKPKDAISGGLYDDFDGTIVDARFVEWDYDGSIDEPVLALCVEINNEEEEQAEGKNPFMQHYSAGPLTNFTPSGDGLEAVPVGSKSGLSDNCNAIMFLTSVVEAGVDEESIGSSIEFLHGIRAHFKRAPQKERKGLAQDEEKGGRKRTILLVESLILENKTTAKSGAKGKAAPAAAAAKPAKPTTKPVKEPEPEQEDEVGQHALAYVMEQLEAGGGTAEKDALPKKVFKYAKENGLDNATRNGILEYVGNEDWLGEQGEYFEFNGETLTAAG